MSGGVAYVYDTDGQFARLCNTDQVELEKPETDDDKSTLKRLLENHVKFTDSPVAKSILADWDNELRWFVKVMPTDYRNALAKMIELEEAAKRLGTLQTVTK